jgi:hypothetical protein
VPEQARRQPVSRTRPLLSKIAAFTTSIRRTTIRTCMKWATRQAALPAEPS